MILYFEATNFISLDNSSIQFVASKKIFDNIDQISKINNFEVLKYGLILGENGSGKSTIVEALLALKSIIYEKRIPINLKEFFNKTNIDNENKVSSFRIIFNYKDEVYEYILKVILSKQIITEEILNKIENAVKNIFINKNNSINLVHYDELYNELKKINKISYRYNIVSINLLNEIKLQEFINKLNRYYKIKDLKLIECSLNDISEALPNKHNDVLKKYKYLNDSQFLVINTGESCYFLTNKKVYKIVVKPLNVAYFLEFSEMSDGFRRLFSLCLLFYIFDDINILFIDEIDKSLHYLVTKKFIEDIIQFSINCNKQIIFTAHSLLLLNENLFRKDEVYFASKLKGITKYISLIEFKENDDPLKKYMDGRFGAIPNL